MTSIKSTPPVSSVGAVPPAATSPADIEPPAFVKDQLAQRPLRGVLFMAAFALMLLLMSRWVDVPLTLAIDRHVSPTLNEVFDYIGKLGDSEMYIFAALFLYAFSIVALRRGWACPVRVGYERLARYGVLVVGTLAIGGLITLILKKVVARARPEVLLEDGWYGLVEPFSKGSDYNSFPSSHTLAAFAVAAAIGEMAPRWRIPALLIATLVAISRVINREHFLSDVTAAAAIGVLVAYFLAPYVLDERRRWMFKGLWRR